MSGDVNSDPVARLHALLGPDVVLVWMPVGQKRPLFRGWRKVNRQTMQDPRYLKALNAGHNLAVAVGASSGGLCSIDIDNDDNAEPFLALNPKLRGSLRSKGQRGCNVWVRIKGAYPEACALRREQDQSWGEWRATGNLTLIHGVHPAGMAYRLLNEAPPVELAFEDIIWPADLLLPWAPREVPLDPEDQALREQFGEPVYFGKEAGTGALVIKAVNEGYWAGLHARENILLFEPKERGFYRYEPESGLYTEESADAIKQGVSARMLKASREEDILEGLERHRTDKTLNAVVAHLRGAVEKKGAFAIRSPRVHCQNGVLKLQGGAFEFVTFSPEFFSRNRSPIAYDPKAMCPRFLNELVGPAVHPEDLVMLQKMAGQCLLGENFVQRFVILDGEPQRGKTQYANVIQELVGLENVTQLRTQHLGERFEMYRFLRRTLLVGVDVPAEFLSTDGANAIKGLVGGDWHDAEQKGGTGSFQVQGKFNLMLTSNCRLRVRLQGDVGAWRRRLLIVRYEAPPPKKKVPDFGALLIREEGSGILNWALEGLRLLVKDVDETGDIRLTERQLQLVDSLLAESDSLRHFLKERVEKRVKTEEAEFDLTVQEIVQAYAEYCPEKGWHPLPTTIIQYQLPNLMLELFHQTKVHDIQRDKAQRGFRNVGLKGGSNVPGT